MAEVKSPMLFVVTEPEPFEGLPARESLCLDTLAALDLTFGKRSDTIGPDADGGAFVVDFGAGDCVRDDAGDSYGDGSRGT